ncbi:hypothetical protein QZN17_17265 [Burkholderia multivorans]|nr:hypothetical protein [Burkholderia multivorans]
MDAIVIGACVLLVLSLGVLAFVVLAAVLVQVAMSCDREEREVR